MKNTISIIMIVIIIVSAFFTTYTEASNNIINEKIGDVNNDGEIDSIDATLVLKHDAAVSELNDNQLAAADVNRDDNVDSLDATLILKYDAGLTDSFITDPDVDDPKSCTIEYLFYSIADMETFIYTGSRDVNDYTQKPEINLEDTPVLTPERYMSLVSKLGINESMFADHEASFQFSEDGKVEYRYYLDNCLIIIKETDYVSVEDYMSENFSDFKKDSVKPYNANDGITDGFVKRESDGVKVIYKMQDEIKRMAVLLSNGYAVTVNGTCYSDYTGTLAKDYQEFMTAEKTAGMAALFNDDEKTFNAAIDSLILV